MWGRSPSAYLTGSVVALCLLSGCTTGSPTGGDVPDRTAPSAAGRPASAGDGAGWVVSLGDSYVSGEGARWGANTSGPGRRVDALGPDAYFDRRGQESEPGCHRASRTVTVPQVAGLRGRNFACSGATTRSDASGVRFTPGLDFSHEPDGDGVGQALALQRFAAHHRVAAIVVSIGGNDFGFGALASRCVTGFGSSKAGAPQLCSDDADLRARFSSQARSRVKAKVTAALHRVSTAMRRAGYAEADYRRILMTYPSPVPPGDRLRFGDTDRDRLGGCPLFAADASWADSVVLPAINATVSQAARSTGSPFEVLDLASAFDGHRLCETGTKRLSETELRSWSAAHAVDRVEWVNQLYTTLAPHQIQESLHPNFWGTAAERACLRLVLERLGAPTYRCTHAGPGLRDGDPVMTLSR